MNFPRHRPFPICGAKPADRKLKTFLRVRGIPFSTRGEIESDVHVYVDTRPELRLLNDLHQCPFITPLINYCLSTKFQHRKITRVLTHDIGRVRRSLVTEIAYTSILLAISVTLPSPRSLRGGPSSKCGESTFRRKHQNTDHDLSNIIDICSGFFHW